MATAKQQAKRHKRRSPSVGRWLKWARQRYLPARAEPLGGPWYLVRGLNGCECPTSAGRCRRPVSGYINDGEFDKHVCREHWRAYHDALRRETESGVPVQPEPRP